MIEFINKRNGKYENSETRRLDFKGADFNHAREAAGLISWGARLKDKRGQRELAVPKECSFGVQQESIPTRYKDKNFRTLVWLYKELFTYLKIKRNIGNGKNGKTLRKYVKE